MSKARILKVWDDLDPDSTITIGPPSHIKPAEYSDDQIWLVDYRIQVAEYSQIKQNIIRMEIYFWRTISQGYKDSLDKNCSAKEHLKDLRDLCRFSNYQREAILEDIIKKLTRGPEGQTHDQWAQAWLGALTTTKEIPDSIWPERRLYREFVKACLIAMPAFGE
ncbi:hypothetical protein OnM2_068079 [Erysiphe neolycopersici]|uniref:Uncharacterized protein n=1 Tax=Erysiphe neolycopersici TaxID=212602 RepID=A0A420HLT7_9PEZI|nr:hypothetical protein OnM2_068079 [Erysiphe neolycopersici]